MEGFDARVSLDDIDELDRQLRRRDVAAFVIETVQGKGCQTAEIGFLRPCSGTLPQIRNAADL